ncbi:hypothetical protein, partial [Enterococcus faecium]|uniref:hypothetical protein n=1 Tax=Enterococcus faecium TaxID=1352 RepID=UPI003D31A4C2
ETILAIYSLFSIFFILLPFTLNEKNVFITEKWVKSFMRDAERFQFIYRDIFAGCRNHFH